MGGKGKLQVSYDNKSKYHKEPEICIFFKRYQQPLPQVLSII